MAEAPKVVMLRGGLSVPDGEPIPSVIELLEKALERAKSGAVCGVIIIGQWQDRSVSQESAGYTEFYPCLGALEEAKYELLSG